LPRSGQALSGRALRGDCQMFHVEHTALQTRLCGIAVRWPPNVPRGTPNHGRDATV